jgi:Asp-tRNA(Asn)/Glu-tRNA(Gln) amidotransferase A subunit family amidase
MLVLSAACAPTPGPKPATSDNSAAMDRDLLDVTISQLRKLYSDKTYTVTQVVQWHLDRIDRYNGVYGAIETVLRTTRSPSRAPGRRARRRAARRTAALGRAVVIKANTSSRDRSRRRLGGLRAGGSRAHRAAGRDGRRQAQGRRRHHRRAREHAGPGEQRHEPQQLVRAHGQRVRRPLLAGRLVGRVVTAVRANMAVLGNGTDTGNSIRMPRATSALVGVFPTRGLVSIAGIAPLDWLLDNTGPIARTATDAAIALSVMAGTSGDPLDVRSMEAPGTAQRAPYEPYLKNDALKGKRFGVPAFVLAGDGIPFHGIPSSVPEPAFEKLRTAANMPLRPETRAAFMKAVDALRAAGAEVVIDDSILPLSFAKLAARVSTYAYMQDGTNRFLATFGPPEYHSAAEYLKAVGSRFSPRRSAPRTSSGTSAACTSISACSTRIRTPSATITRRGARCSPPISNRSIV